MDSKKQRRTLQIDPCRFGKMWWGTLAAASVHVTREWAETWAFLETQEEADEDEKQIVDLEEEILEVVKDSAGECVL